MSRRRSVGWNGEKEVAVSTQGNGTFQRKRGLYIMLQSERKKR
jgi:hypothetical protein